MSPASPGTDQIETLLWIGFVAATIIVVAINGALFLALRRNRATRGVEVSQSGGARRGQLRVGVALGVFALATLVLGLVFTERAREVPASGPAGLAVKGADRLTIKATGQQWLWRYEYPDNETFYYYELVVPVDTAVVVNLVSTDVVHRWFVPGLGGKFDAVPDQSNATWFKADEEGVYNGASYQFSGASYAAMRTQVRVVSVPEYRAWLEQQAADIQEAQTFVQEELAIRGATGTEAGAENVEAPPQEEQQ